jgi:hypothetical protein
VKALRKANDTAHKLHAGQTMTSSEAQQLAHEQVLCNKCASHCHNALHLKGGYRGTQIVSKVQLRQMYSLLLQDMPKEYRNELPPLSRRTLHQLVMTVLAKSDTSCTSDTDSDNMIASQQQQQLSTTLSDIFDTPISFNHFCVAVRKLRANTLENARLSVVRPPGVAEWIYSEPTDPFGHRKRASRRRKQERKRDLSRSQKLISRMQKRDQFDGDETDFLTTALLHRNAHKVATLEDKNSASVTSSVYLMRHLEPDSVTRWDGARALRGNAVSSYVKPFEYEDNDD